VVQAVELVDAAGPAAVQGQEVTGGRHYDQRLVGVVGVFEVPQQPSRAAHGRPGDLGDCLVQQYKLPGGCISASQLCRFSGGSMVPSGCASPRPASTGMNSTRARATLERPIPTTAPARLRVALGRRR